MGQKFKNMAIFMGQKIQKYGKNMGKYGKIWENF